MSFASAACSRSVADWVNALVIFCQDSLSPLGGSYLLIEPASWTYSFVCGWIWSQGGVSSFNSRPMTLVSDCGPFVSLAMISLMGPRWPPGGGPPLFDPWSTALSLFFLNLSQAVAETRTATIAPKTRFRPTCFTIE